MNFRNYTITLFLHTELTCLVLEEQVLQVNFKGIRNKGTVTISGQ